MGRQFVAPGHRPPRRPCGPLCWAARAFALALALSCVWVLVPVFISAKVAQERTGSLSRFKNIGTAVNVYLAEFDDRFPPASRWQDLSEPYAKDPTCFAPGPDLRGANFAFNRALDGILAEVVENPSATPLVFESSLQGRNAAGGLREVMAADGYMFVFTAVDSSTKGVRIENAPDRPWSAKEKP